MKQTFLVTLTFSGKITSDEDLQEIARNIADSIKHSADTYGIAPENSDEYTKKIEVAPQFLPEAKVELTVGI